MRATITATARYLPERVLTNFDMEKIIDTSDEWIRTRTGIETRHIVSNGQATADLSTHVAKQLLERSGTKPEDLDIIILATVTPDRVFPSTAAIIQDNISAKNAWGFDLSGACTGFLYALETGANFIASGRYKKVMVIGAETMSSIIDYTDRNTCVLFGDGAGGVMLEPATNDEGILDSIMHIDGSGADFLQMPAGGSLLPASYETVDKRLHSIQQDGKTVFKFAVRGMAEVSADILKRNNLNGQDIKLFIPHQANKRIIDAAAQRCDISENQVLININKYGNTTAATIPIGIDESVEDGRLKKGDLVLLAAFGAGFTWGSTLIRWGNIS